MTKCFNCDNTGKDIQGYPVCDKCKTKLRLFSQKTIKRYYNQKGEEFTEDIKYRLDVVEKDYIKKKIKLLSILEILGMK